MIFNISNSSSTIFGITQTNDSWFNIFAFLSVVIVVGLIIWFTNRAAKKYGFGR